VYKVALKLQLINQVSKVNKENLMKILKGPWWVDNSGYPPPN
jgi:hypothetical protein